MTEFLPRLNIRQMDLDGRNSHRRDGVPDSHARMSETRGVQDDNVRVTLRLLNPVHQFPLDVRLLKVNFGFEISGPLPNPGFNVSQGGSSIDFRLGLAKQVEIRAVEKQYFHGASI